MKTENLKLEQFDNGVRVYQSEDLYKFTMDAILLAKFCNIKHTDEVLELCAGSGVISFYAYSLCPFKKFYFNEIQTASCKVIKKNIELNGFENKSSILNCNLKDLSIADFNKPLDVIICNPPYLKLSKNSQINEKKEIAIARHELEATLEDVIATASKLIKDKGRFYMVHLASRTTEIVNLCTKHKMEVKQMKFVFNGNKDAYLVLLEAVKNAKSGVRVLKNCD